MVSIQAITYEGARAVTKSDTTADPIGPFAGLIVTVTGTLKFTTVLGDTVTLSATTLAQIIPIAVQRVWSTGTGATVLGLVAAPYVGNAGGTT